MKVRYRVEKLKRPLVSAFSTCSRNVGKYRIKYVLLLARLTVKIFFLSDHVSVYRLQMNSSYGRPSPPPIARGFKSEDAVLSTTTVGLELEVNSFRVGKMRIRCVAELYGVFKTTAETVLDEEKPRLASILGTFSSTGNCCARPGPSDGRCVCGRENGTADER